MTKPRRSRQDPAVRDFILRNVDEHPGSIVTFAAKSLGLSRATVHRYVVRLQKDNLLSAQGGTRARRYRLKVIAAETFKLKVHPRLEEHTVWRFRILPVLKGAPDNILGICSYGFTEMLNNVKDHSMSEHCLLGAIRTYSDITIIVRDFGKGIFRKIQDDFNLEDSRSALLELSKGKLTSDKKHHSGEGIYFTSRMFDLFSITSGDLFYRRSRKEDDEWLIQTGDRDRETRGTSVFLKISTNNTFSTSDVFKKYIGDNLRFRKTHVPLFLGLYPSDELVSRSQAKRVLSRFESFSEVLLDFAGVSHIGQPFADEIFRVFAAEHPEIEVIAIRANPGVQRVIDYVRSGSPESQPELPF